MNEEQAKEMIELLKSIDKRLKDIEYNTSLNIDACTEIETIRKIIETKQS